MPVTSFEILGRNLNDTSVVRQYYFHGPATEAEVIAAIGNLPATVAGLPYATAEASEVQDISGDYQARVTWGVPQGGQGQQPQQPIGTTEYRFNFTAPSAHVKRSLATISRTALTGVFPGNNAPNYNTLVGVVEGPDGVQVEGIELAPPNEVFTLSVAADNGFITGTYQSLVESLCGKVNSTVFRGKQPGEVMLVRASGGKSAQNSWSIELGFGYIANNITLTVAGIVIPQGARGISKKGFELLWTLDRPRQDAVAKIIVPTPVAAYVEQIWPEADLNLLYLPV